MSCGYLSAYFEGGNFHELVIKLDFTEKTFVDCLLVQPAVQTITKKYFFGRHKIAKFAKVFSLKGFPLYGS